MKLGRLVHFRKPTLGLASCSGVPSLSQKGRIFVSPKTDWCSLPQFLDFVLFGMNSLVVNRWEVRSPGLKQLPQVTPWVAMDALSSPPISQIACWGQHVPPAIPRCDSAWHIFSGVRLLEGSQALAFLSRGDPPFLKGQLIVVRCCQGRQGKSEGRPTSRLPLDAHLRNSYAGDMHSTLLDGSRRGLLEESRSEHSADFAHGNLRGVPLLVIYGSKDPWRNGCGFLE